MTGAGQRGEGGREKTRKEKMESGDEGGRVKERSG